MKIFKSVDTGRYGNRYQNVYGNKTILKRYTNNPASNTKLDADLRTYSNYGFMSAAKI